MGIVSSQRAAVPNEARASAVLAIPRRDRRGRRRRRRTGTKRRRNEVHL